MREPAIDVDQSFDGLPHRGKSVEMLGIGDAAALTGRTQRPCADQYVDRCRDRGVARHRVTFVASVTSAENVPRQTIVS